MKIIVMLAVNFVVFNLSGCSALEGLGDLCLHDNAYMQSECLKRVSQERTEREARRKQEEEYEAMHKENEEMDAQLRRRMEEYYRKQAEGKK
ncbi:MAG: hypothetical protein OEY00_01020 [Gammaproteobacteria bacterium]|nr:hypothetical protein [Gammaproteobacteria bacterium]